MCKIDEVFIKVNELSVSLRSLKIEDALDMAAVINNKKVQDNMLAKLPFPYTEKDAKKLIKSALSAKRDSYYIFAIVYEGKVIGSVGAHRITNDQLLSAEIGYLIAEPYWNKGIASDVVLWMSALIFENTDIARVFAKTFSNNIASCRVLENAGFLIENVLPRSELKNGQLMDMTIYAMVKQMK